MFLVSSVASAQRKYPYDHAPKTDRIVNFWATWCEACRAELTEWNKGLTVPKGWSIVLVNLDSKPELGSNWLKANFKLQHVEVADPDYKVADGMKLESFPTTYFVDQNGNVTYEQGNYNEDSLKKLNDALSAASKS